MKATIDNKQVELALLNGEHVWLESGTTNIIGKAADFKAEYDCTEERLAIGEALKAARKAAGISQEKLESITGITKNNIIQYEKGRMSPGVDILTRIGNAIGHQFFADLK